LLHQDEEMSALGQLKEKANKKKAKLKKQKKDKKIEERKFQRLREEVFRALKQFKLNGLYQGRLLCFKRVAKV
jgi:hypothetical protein